MSQKIIFIVSIIVVVLVLGYSFLWMKSGFVDYRPPSAITSDNGNNSVIPIQKDEAESWHTYRNEKHGFEIKYPPGWEYSLGDPPDESSPAFGPGPSNRFRPLIFIIVDENHPIVREQEFDSDILERKEINIGGVKGEYILYQPHAKQSLAEKAVFFSKDKTNFLISSSEGTDEEKSLEVFDKMLSTFRFIR